METKYITIEFTADEIQTLGDSVCMAIKKTIETLTADAMECVIDDHIQEERAILCDLTSAGYQLYIDAYKGLQLGKYTIDVDEWITHAKARELSKKGKK